MKKSSYSIAILSAVLVACGGGGGGGSSPDPEPPPPTTGFTEDATWTVAPPAGGESVCYDFDAKAEAACAGTAWDVKLTGAARGAPSLSTNSGPSGEGGGGAFATPFDHTWEDLLTWSDAFTDSTGAVIPERLYFADTATGVFTGDNGIQSAAFEYGLDGGHLLFPTYRVFLITTDSASADPVGSAASPVFALQVTGYYGGASGTESGHVSFQWVDRMNPGSINSATVDARTDWVYFDLVTGIESSETGEWQIAFNRYNLKLNGGASGAGSSAGFIGKTPDGLYNADGEPIAAAFLAFDSTTPATMAAELTAADLEVPAAAGNWVQDATGSQLAPAYQGSYPGALDYGWYSYYPTADAAAAAGLPAVPHLLGANPDRGALVRSGEGNSYARMRLADIIYADPDDSGSATTWTFEFGIQPAQAN